MVAKRKVAKKKTTKASASRKATVPQRTAKSTPKKKGVAAKRKPAATTITLGGAVVISDVMEWHGKMLEAITDQDEIVLDGGAVEQIDGVGLQLLVALMKEAVAGKTKVSWKSASDVLRNNAAQLGLTAILGLDQMPETE